MPVDGIMREADVKTEDLIEGPKAFLGFCFDSGGVAHFVALGLSVAVRSRF
jgi:hypothetical protein